MRAPARTIVVSIVFLTIFCSTGRSAAGTVTLPAGQRITIRLGATLSSSENDSEDLFKGALAADLAAGGVVVAREGDAIQGRVIEAKKAGRIVRKAALAIELTGINVGGTPYPLLVHPLEFEGEKTGDLKKIGLKTAVGALVGGADLAKRMAVGGTAVAAITPGNQLELPEGIFLEFYLSQPLVLNALSKPVALDPAAAAAAYTHALYENMRILKDYQWRRSVELRVEGELELSRDFLRRLVVKTILGEDALQMEIDFTKIAGGPFHAPGVEFIIPTKKVDGTVKSFDFFRRS